MEKVGFASLAIIVFIMISCGNSSQQSNMGVEDVTEKFNREEDSFHEKIIEYHLLHEDKTVRLGQPYKIQFMDGITLISVTEYSNNCNVDEVKNPKNKLKENEKYVAFKVNYKFDVYKIQKYGNDNAIELTWAYYQSDWIVLDEKGTYYKPLEWFVPEAQPFKEEDVKNEGKQPVLSPPFGGSLVNGENTGGWLTFKVNSNVNLKRIIYGAKMYESIVETPVTFAVSLPF